MYCSPCIKPPLPVSVFMYRALCISVYLNRTNNIQTWQKLQTVKKKSRIQETLNSSACADSSTNAFIKSICDRLKCWTSLDVFTFFYIFNFFGEFDYFIYNFFFFLEMCYIFDCLNIIDVFTFLEIYDRFDQFNMFERLNVLACWTIKFGLKFSSVKKNSLFHCWNFWHFKQV